jgi:hypothetical protein
MSNPTTDFSIFDGQELVTYNAGGGGTFTGVRAVRRPLSISRARNIESLGIALEATDVVFFLDAAPLAAELAAGQTVTDAQSTDYTVLFVERQSLGLVVVAVCRPT